MKPFHLLPVHPAPGFVAAVLFTLCSNPLQAQERVLGPSRPARDAARAAQGSAFLPNLGDVKSAPEPSRSPEPVLASSNPELAPASATSEPTPRANAPTQRAPIAGRRSIDHSRMYYNEPGDGSLWVRGAHYKASFDAQGATYFPLFSACQPRHYPHALSPDMVTIGGARLALDRAATAERQGDRVQLERGGFIEAYDFAPDSIEQSFVFTSLPSRGDLVVHIPIGSELESSARADGLEFRSELGRVTYGRATVIDASGRRAAAETALADGAITIRVDAGFLAGAVLPLTIDPVVSVFAIDNSSYDDSEPDVAYDAGTQRWLAVYEENVNTSDVDVYYEILNASGASMWGGYVDSSTDDWLNAKCANLASANQFLVVAWVLNPSTGDIDIRGRTIQANIFSISPAFVIDNSQSGHKLYPAVGGDPFPSAPAYYCVTYQRSYSSTDQDILVRLVGPDRSLSAVNYFSNSAGTYDTFPSISKSDDGDTWTIVWERQQGVATYADVWGGRIRWDGAVVANPFQITSSGYQDYAPCVSSPLDNSQRTMVVYGTHVNNSRHNVAALLDGSTILEYVDLTALDGGTASTNQWYTSVDTDGRHFLVSYLEFVLGPPGQGVYVDDFFLSGYALGVSQGHVLLSSSNVVQQGNSIAATRDSWGPPARCLAAWTTSAAAGKDVMGALFDANAGGSWYSYCPGDGTSSPACPCGNSGASGHGCANSVNSSGALLTLTGTTSTVADTVVLQVSGVPNSVVCTFLQAAAGNYPAVFGDGLRCMSGTIIRLKSVAASNGVASFPAPGDPAVSVKGLVPVDGGSRVYQVSYRDPAAFCTSATFNISSAVVINWAR
jgi:hypothetical protein